MPHPTILVTDIVDRMAEEAIGDGLSGVTRMKRSPGNLQHAAIEQFGHSQVEVNL